MTVQTWLVPLLWVLWLLPFLIFRPKSRPKPAERAPRARWGILLQTIAYWIIYIPSTTKFVQELPIWRIAGATAAGLFGISIAALAIRHLGKQWRFDAALNADHELVRSGPYRWVRHPIYASMLSMLVMSILFLGGLPGWPVALVLFLVGIEIRVHTEDQLLRGRFGKIFDEWKSHVPAYLPFVH